MRYLTSTEATQKFAAVLDAVQRGPIVIREDSRDLAVLISAQEYRRLRLCCIWGFLILMRPLKARAR